MLRHLYLLVLILGALCPSSQAHQDRILTCRDGVLTGLPEKYSPAAFSSEKRTIRSGGLQVRIPDCLWQLWGEPTDGDFRFTASWYHDPKILPPYLEIAAPGTEPRVTYRVLVNLDTLEFLSLRKESMTGEGHWQIAEVPIDTLCRSHWSVMPAISVGPFPDKDQLNPEGSVRPERGGAVNTTIVESTRANLGRELGRPAGEHAP